MALSVHALGHMLQKTTGLDLRSFDDAVTFKIALMVESYLKHMSESMD